MIKLDANFYSCHSLQQFFEPLSPDLVALQLSRGPLQGRLRIFHCGALRFNLLETNQTLFLSGARRPEPCTLAFPFRPPTALSPCRAQGISVAWPALIGYNSQLTDFDLRVPAGTHIATIVIGRNTLLEQLERRGGDKLTLERLKNTNQLELLPESLYGIRDQIEQLIRLGKNGWSPAVSDQLIEIILRSFAAPQVRTRFVRKREPRHEAAIDLLHWLSNKPNEIVTIEELAEKLHYSRTTIFKGAREHFERTPLQVQRSIRLDRVRHLLLNPTLRTTLGLKGVVDSATTMGFSSRSHFAQRYQEQYGEDPQTTLNQGLRLER